MREPEALTSSSPLSFQLLFLFPTSASSRAESSSCKMAGLNSGGPSLRILRLPAVHFSYVLSPWAHRTPPSSSYGGTLAAITGAFSDEVPPGQISTLCNSLCFEWAIGASPLLERLGGVRSGDCEGCCACNEGPSAEQGAYGGVRGMGVAAVAVAVTEVSFKC